MRPDTKDVAHHFGVQVSMLARPALSCGYGVRDHTEPAPGTQMTDQVKTANSVHNSRQRGGLT